ncbi:MAG: hypothetical protein JJU41_00725 [Bacteroidetes bacterium]|nr:hypothetical protein [Bacteroidota bacterium]
MARTIAAVEQTGAQRMQQLYEELFGTQAQIKSSLTRTTKWMVNLLMIFVLSGCGALFGDKDKDNPMQIELSPLEARVGVSYDAKLKVSDLDGVGLVRVTSPDSSWVLDGEGRSEVVFDVSKEFDAPGKRRISVEGSDLKGRDYSSVFDLDVLDAASNILVWVPRRNEATSIYTPETRVRNQDGIDSVRVTRLDTGVSELYVGDGGSLLSFEWSSDYSSLRLNTPLSIDHSVDIFDSFG